jgi:hypothetical protein
MHPFLALEKLTIKAQVWVRNPPGSLDKLEGVIEALAFPPHQVGDDQRRGARHPVAAMHKHAATLLPNVLKVIKHVVQDAGDVLDGAVQQPEGAVDKVRLEVLRADEAHAVEKVGDAVLPQDVAVLGDDVATEDLGALLVEEGDLVLASLRGSEERSSRSPSPGLAEDGPPPALDASGVVGWGHSLSLSELALGHSSRLRRVMASGCNDWRQDRALELIDRRVSGGGGTHHHCLPPLPAAALTLAYKERDQRSLDN